MRDGLDVEDLGQFLPFHFVYSYSESKKENEEAENEGAKEIFATSSFDLSYRDFKESLHQRRKELTEADERLYAVRKSPLRGKIYKEELSDARDNFELRTKEFRQAVHTLLRQQKSNNALDRRVSFAKSIFEKQEPSVLAVIPTREELVLRLRSESLHKWQQLLKNRLHKRKPQDKTKKD